MPNSEDLFVLKHIDDSHNDLINDFKIKHKTGRGLEVYLKTKALIDEKNGVMRTYILTYKSTNECVAYFSLKSGLISIKNEDSTDMDDFDTLPGIEIANFAINDTFREKNKIDFKLAGLILQKYILPIARKVSEQVGVYLLYIFSLPIDKVMDNYKEMGFVTLPQELEDFLNKRVKPAYDKSCRFMYFPMKP